MQKNSSEPDLFKALLTRGALIQPQQGRLEYHLLFRHVEKVTGEDFCQLIHTERQELLLGGGGLKKKKKERNKQDINRMKNK